MSVPGDTTDGVSARDLGEQIAVVVTRDNIDEIEQVCHQALRLDQEVLLACPQELVGELPEITAIANISIVAASTEEESHPENIGTELDESLLSEYSFVEGSSIVTERSGTDESARGARSRKTKQDIQHLVAIPAYNEEETIRDVAEAALEHTDEVVVIDDGSDDNTIREAWRAGVDIVAHTQNRGYGSALQTAFDIAEQREVETLVILDGDGQHDPEDIPGLVEQMENADANVAIGSRFVSDTSADIPLYRWFGLMVINVLTNISLGNITRASWINDTQSGFRAYDQEAIDQLSSAQAIGDDMGASLDILYRISENGYIIEEYPVVVDYDVPSGSSKNPVTHGFGLILTILRTTVQKYTVPVLVLSTLFLLILLTSLYVGLVGSY